MASLDRAWHSNARRIREKSCWSDPQSGVSPSSVACVYLSRAPTRPTHQPATRTCSRLRFAAWSSASSSRASGSATWRRAPSSSTPRITTWCARACCRAALIRRPRAWTCSAPAARASRRRSTSATRSRSDRSRSASPAASIPSATRRSSIRIPISSCCCAATAAGAPGDGCRRGWTCARSTSSRSCRPWSSRAPGCRWARAPRSWRSAGRSPAPSRTSSPTTVT